jgi:hypothetical protein
MKNIILLLSFIALKNTAQSQIYVGANTALTYSELKYGAIVKGHYKAFQSAFTCTHSFFTNELNIGVQIGANFVNLDHIKIGSNIMIENDVIHYPSLNVTQRLQDNMHFDLNFRPHYSDLFRFEFSLIYQLKK